MREGVVTVTVATMICAAVLSVALGVARANVALAPKAKLSPWDRGSETRQERFVPLDLELITSPAVEPSAPTLALTHAGVTARGRILVLGDPLTHAGATDRGRRWGNR